MGRPRKDAASVVQVKLSPPSTMNDKMRALWAREFDRFPPGYYVPADVNGMLVYLHTVAEYDAAMARAAAARKPADARAERVEVRAIRKQLLLLQRALRMYPVTRSHNHTASTMANAAQPQERAADTPEEPAWKGMMRDVGALPPRDKRVQ